MDEVYKPDGSVWWRVGWHAKCTHNLSDSHKEVANRLLVVQEISRNNKGHVALRFNGSKYWYWEGFFVQVAKQFKPGDKVKYVGANYNNAYAAFVGKTLTVLSINPSLSDNLSLVINFVEFQENEWMNGNNFEKIVVPDFKEVLFKACNDGHLDEWKDLYLEISNHRAAKLGLTHTKQDILSVLRILEKYHVKGRIWFHTELKEELNVSIDGREIMEELSNSASSTLPIAALEEIANVFDVVAYVGAMKYSIGFDLAVYETQTTAMQSVQEAK